MRIVLRLGAISNFVLGLMMVVFYNESYESFGLCKPVLPLSYQLVGMLVIILGIGYWLSARIPIENQNLLLLGTKAKALGPCFSISYIYKGVLAMDYKMNLLIGDIIWIAPFIIILVRIYIQHRIDWR